MIAWKIPYGLLIELLISLALFVAYSVGFVVFYYIGTNNG